MKIFVVGGNGTIGKKVSHHLSKKHEVIIGTRQSKGVSIDITDSRSIKNAFEKIGTLDAVVCIAGEAKWAEFSTMTEQDYEIGLKSKLMGQVNLVKIGRDYLNFGGSFTLTTGILADHPVAITTSAVM